MDTAEIRIYTHDHDGVMKLHGVTADTAEEKYCQLWIAWKHFEDRMLCMPGTDVPLQNLNQSLLDFNGVVLETRPWTPEYQNLRVALSQFEWPPFFKNVTP